MRKTDAKTLKSCLPQWLREHELPLHMPEPGAPGRAPFYGVQ